MIIYGLYHGATEGPPALQASRAFLRAHGAGRREPHEPGVRRGSREIGAITRASQVSKQALKGSIILKSGSLGG